jgi:SAM-dependent methyltransferase
MKKALVALVAFPMVRAGRLFARAARVFNHLAAGTLTLDELRAGIERNWEDFNASDAAVAAGLTRWEAEMIGRFVTREDDLLLVGSGPGRDLIALVGDGYRVTGVEPARRASAICRRQLAVRGLAADVLEGFFEEVALPRRFDAIIFSGCCYSFMPESRRRIAALRKAAAHLAPGGRILINYMTEQPQHPMLIRLTRFAATATRSDWRPEPGDVLLSMDSARPLFNYEHRFKSGEIDAEALAAGLHPVHHCDFPNAPVIVLEAAADGRPQQDASRDRTTTG